LIVDFAAYEGRRGRESARERERRGRESAREVDAEKEKRGAQSSPLGRSNSCSSGQWPKESGIRESARREVRR